jgi:hypothetical protein
MIHTGVNPPDGKMYTHRSNANATP